MIGAKPVQRKVPCRACRYTRYFRLQTTRVVLPSGRNCSPYGAGGALMGVISAALRFGGINLLNEKWLEGNFAEPLAVVMYIALMAYLAISSLSAKKE